MNRRALTPPRWSASRFPAGRSRSASIVAIVILAWVITPAISRATPAPPLTWEQPTLTTIAETWYAPFEAEVPTWWHTLVALSISCTLPAAGEDAGCFAHVHSLSARSRQPTADATAGVFNPASNIAAERHLRVMSLYFHRGWQGGRQRVKLGQISLDDDFMLSSSAALFLNAAFGSLPSQVGTPLGSTFGNDAAYPVYPFAAPGVWFQFDPGRRWSVQSAVYLGSAGRNESSNHGLDWKTHSNAGVVGFTELTRRDANDPARITRLGLALHAGRHDNNSATLAGRPGETRRGIWSVYAMQDLALLRNSHDAPLVVGFARVGCSPQTDRSAVALSADSGATWIGPLSCRPEDKLGVAVAWTRFSTPYRSVHGLHRSETVVELTYAARVTSRFLVQGDVQCVHAGADVPSSRRPVMIVGLRGVLSY